MLRNVASQKWRVYAWDTTTGLAKTGDAANISAYITKDDGTPTATNDTAPTELSSTNEPGYYDFDLTQAETNAAKVSLSPKSSTSNIAVIACPPVTYTVPQYFSLLGIASDGDISGNVDGSVASVLGGINTAAGTITTLDGLDTAQDTQHGTTQSAIDGLNNVSSSDVQTAATASLNAYDGPTKAELDAAIAALNDIDSAAVIAAVASALATYDGPTKAELDAAQSALATLINALNDFDPANDTVAHVTLVDTTTTNTDMRGTDSANTTTPPTVAAIAAGLLDLTDGVETDYTVRQLLRLLLAVIAGDSTAGTTYKNPAGTKSRIVSTIDGSNNRTVSSRDVS